MVQLYYQMITSVLNGVNSMSCILLVSSPPVSLKNALIDEVDLTLASNLISSVH